MSLFDRPCLSPDYGFSHARFPEGVDFERQLRHKLLKYDVPRMNCESEKVKRPVLVRIAQDTHIRVPSIDVQTVSWFCYWWWCTQLMAGMTFFFTLGALGGMISMVMQGKPAFQSSHFITGSVGLVLLYLQGMLSLFFEDDPNARTAHAFLGTGVMAVFFAHMLVGLKFGLSF